MPAFTSDDKYVDMRIICVQSSFSVIYGRRYPSNECVSLFSVQTRHEEQNPGCRFWVVSRQLANSFISAWCRTVIEHVQDIPLPYLRPVGRMSG